MCYRETVDVWCFKTTETKRGGGGGGEKTPDMSAVVGEGVEEFRGGAHGRGGGGAGVGNTITVPTVEKVNETVCSLLLTLLWVICRPFEE